MTKIVINADDFGYSKAVNLGIIETYKYGILTSTTMMANMSGFEHGIEISRENPGLAIGVHLNLTCGRPILKNVDTLTDINGNFKSLKVYKENTGITDFNQLLDEWDAQISKLLKNNIKPTHLDSHHYVHSFAGISEVVEVLSKKYKLPVRKCLNIEEKIKDKDIFKTDIFWNLFNFKEMKNMEHPYKSIKEKLYRIIEKNAENYHKFSTVEASCHPAYMDTDIYFGSSFNIARMREIEVLCDPYIDEILKKYGFDYCNYADL